MNRSNRLIGILAVVTAGLVPAKTEGADSPPPQTAAEAPVEFIFDGITPDKASVSYRIKVNTDKPINEVHLALKEWDAAGKVLTDTTVVWANIAHSTRQPIEKGKTYEDRTSLLPGAVKAECSLKEIVFKDYTRSSASSPTPQSPTTTTIPSSGDTLGSTRSPDSPTPKASLPASTAKGDAEDFVKSFYHDMEQDDLEKVMGYFDEKVDYYTYGRKDKPFIADQLRQYFVTFPVRSFSVGDGKAQPAKGGAISAIFDIRYTLRNSANGAASTGRSHVEWDIVKRSGALKIVRFTGTSTPDAPQ